MEAHHDAVVTDDDEVMTDDDDDDASSDGSMPPLESQGDGGGPQQVQPQGGGSHTFGASQILYESAYDVASSSTVTGPVLTAALEVAEWIYSYPHASPTAIVSNMDATMLVKLQLVIDMAATVQYVHAATARGILATTIEHVQGGAHNALGDSRAACPCLVCVTERGGPEPLDPADAINALIWNAPIVPAPWPVTVIAADLQDVEDDTDGVL